MRAADCAHAVVWPTSPLSVVVVAVQWTTCIEHGRAAASHELAT
eukprot:COSAG01_NODE_297_length_19258_cov_8.905110_5_plen_44_part_00